MAIDLDGLEEQEAITLTEEAAGKTTLRVTWKKGNGKVVEMATKQAMSKSVWVKTAKSAGVGLLLGFIQEIFSSPSTSPQDVAKPYPKFVGTPNEDKFWNTWVGPGRGFPLPPLDPAERPQWLVDYWPENMPINLPNPGPLPKVDSKPIDDNNDDKGYITLYRGVGDEVDPLIVYTLAMQGIAYPKGLLPGHEPHSNPELHTGGDINSIYTSWTIYRSKAEEFARGKSGNARGIILAKKFKKSQLVQSRLSTTEHFEDEGEFLIPGVVTGASTETLEKKDN